MFLGLCIHSDGSYGENRMFYRSYGNCIKVTCWTITSWNSTNEEPSYVLELRCCVGNNQPYCRQFFFPIEKWLVEIPGDVCMYGKGDKPGVFFTPMAGKIYSIRLVHISGKVSCTPEDESNWGYHSFIDTILTDKDDHVVFPEDQIANYYELPGFTGNSPELVLTFTSPLVVNAGQEYRLWYWEDLVNDTEEDNKPGPSCMKVIYLFSDWFS